VELTREERKRLANRISMTVANLAGPAMFYWLPGERRITARSVVAAKRHRLPGEAQLIGTYCWPCRAAYVLEDLAELLAHPPVPAAAQAPRGETTATVAAPRCDRELVHAVRTRPPAPFNPTFAPAKTPALDHPYRTKMVLRTAERRAKRRIQARAAMQLSKLV
jgi:hypothetical protein